MGARSQRIVGIVGAGLGGLAAAIELAAAGREVVLLERATAPGGKVAEIIAGGQAIDGGPGALTLRPVFEQLFATAGTRLETHLALRRLPVLGRHVWPDGRHLDLMADPAEAAAAIGDFAGAAAARGFRDYLARAARCYQALERPFLRAQRPGALRFGAQAGLRGVLGLSPFDTLWDALGEHFPDPRLRQLFARLASYVGSSPLLAPATLMLVGHVEQAGMWAVEGGMRRLPEALAAAAAGCGTRLRLGCAVEEVLVARGRVAGLRLADGEVLETDRVVVNADPATLAVGRLGAAAARAVPALPVARRSFSALSWAIAGRAEGRALPRMTVFHPAEPTAEYAELAYRGRLPARPTVTLWAQDRDGVAAAPAETERLLALVSAPARVDHARSDEAALAAAEASMVGIAARAGVVLRRDAVTRTTPADHARAAPGTGGALYGPAVHGWQSIFSRPAARTALPGLYLAGGSTHPGSGLAMAALSGRLAAAALIEDEREG